MRLSNIPSPSLQRFTGQSQKSRFRYNGINLSACFRRKTRRSLLNSKLQISLIPHCCEKYKQLLGENRSPSYFQSRLALLKSEKCLLASFSKFSPLLVLCPTQKQFFQLKKKKFLSSLLAEAWLGFPGPGARFSKVPVTLRARNQIFKSKYKE